MGAHCVIEWKEFEIIIDLGVFNQLIYFSKSYKMTRNDARGIDMPQKVLN